MKPPDLTTAALLDHIQTRYHEVHRRELPAIVALARALGEHGVASGLADRLAMLAQALEAHLFKEEMRLFPMMEQGGNTLIGHLIDDMQAEHGVQRDELAALEADLAAVSAPAASQALLDELRAALAKLFADLAEHMRVEDEELFPRFAPTGSPR